MDIITVLPYVVQGIFSLILAFLTYLFGRKRSNAEVQRIEGEKRNVEAAAGLSTAEAASIISRAAADVVQPLTSRIHELQKDAKIMADRHAHEMNLMNKKYCDLENHVAVITKENIDLKNQIARLEAKIAILSKPHELAIDTTKRLGEM